MIKAHQIVFKTEMERWAGNYFEPQTAAYTVHNSTPATSSTHHHSFTPSLTFPDAVKIYFAHHERAWAPRTAAKKRNILERFLEIVSKDRPGLTVQDISRTDCVAYRDLLQTLPNNMRSKSVWQALKGKQVGPRISRNTVNQCLEHVGHLFTWLKDEGKYTGDNPASRLQLKGIDAMSRSRVMSFNVSSTLHSPQSYPITPITSSYHSLGCTQECASGRLRS